MAEIQNRHDVQKERETYSSEAQTATRLFSEVLDTVRVARQRTELRSAEQTSSPNQVGQFQISNIWSEMNLSGDRLGRAQEDLHPAQIQRTTVRGVGANDLTQVQITSRNGVATNIRDHLGLWTSEDGRTWTTGEPHYRVRRGSAQIDATGTYSFHNEDYGVRTSLSPDGTTRREVTIGGVTYSHTRNAMGEPVAFTDERGQWTMQGNRWVHEDAVQQREGDVDLTSFGRFSFRPRAGSDGQTRVTEQLREIQALTRQIEERFRLRIAPEGAQRVDYRATNIAGTPTLRELQVLQSVLERSPVRDYENRMTVWFIRPDEMRPGDAQSHMGHLASENSPRRDHSCDNCSRHGLVRDGNHMVIMPSARQTPEGFNGLEGTVIHELVHYEQSRFFVRGNEGWGTGRQRTPEIERIVNDLGWRFWSGRAENGRAVERSALIDRQNNHWVSNTDREGNTTWRRVVGGVLQNGRLVGGQVSSRNDSEHRLNNEQMAERAAVPQGTGYFIEPDETLANLFAMFRVSTASATENRRTLAVNHPQLYATVRRLDQEFINRGLRRDARQPELVRDLEGRIVLNTSEVSREIRESEMQW
jgi:hypothetical protein